MVPNSCKHKTESYLFLCFVLFKTPDSFDQYGKSRCNYSFWLKEITIKYNLETSESHAFSSRERMFVFLGLNELGKLRK